MPDNIIKGDLMPSDKADAANLRMDQEYRYAQDAAEPGDKRVAKMLDEYHICAAGESWPEYDAQNIYLCRVCDECREIKLSGYRPEILTGYSQADVDEPIESD